ncbi:hypothetical protein JVT61DRAFT_5187 [Boletus reticuloceps]|uniref:Uncharacterized protein n=1 Tax=Boletus reticuloceps TaxID=495285 RepID=A0A8I2Z0Z3_9AGAM|nr:hypothetical protein JVT61DRAFT_5187 [Boletus reticuloceps]
MQSRRNSTDSQSPGPGPTWAAPRSPLPPYRLAKLANALGVSTPLPAMTSSTSSLSSHLGNPPSPSNTDLPWRSVTPSTVTALNVVSPVQSTYLLHVIPPVHLPHDADSSDSSDLAPPPSTASGYHTQFRRGTLVALQSTLHAQLLVIAREYALPSTIGIILYLVTASPQGSQHTPLPSSSPVFDDASGGEPGPRLSEKIWKHIWTRVLRAERGEVITLSRSGTPNPLATPARTEHPRPLACPVTPSTSTSTASSVSDVRSHDKSAGTSSPHSEPNTPDTSHPSDHGPPDVELPGLNSHSIIPILAKVEFDIDKRKATWYEPWVRSRRMKRTESRSSYRSRSPSRTRTLDSNSSADEKRAPYDLKLVQRMQKPPFLRSHDDFHEQEQLNSGVYAPLSESPDTDAAARMTSTMGQDPLGDVFGTDAETWTEIHAESDGVKRKANNPNVVELALDATSLTALPERRQEEGGGETNDVNEVRDIVQRMSRPPLDVSILDAAEIQRRSSSSTAVGKRPMPPPLVLVPNSLTNNLIVGEADDFRNKEGSSLELEQEYQRSRSHGEEKRVGTVFEDLDLGLDLGDDDEEYDEDDPNDRRRSQYLMKAKLDEIERTLAQFSPQQLKTAVLDENSTTTHHRSLSTASQSRTPALAERTSASPLHKAWPSIPYASVTKTVNVSPTRPVNLPPSPPRLALNGVSTGAPKAFMPASSASSTVPTESQVRRRELEQAMYPATMSSPSRQVNIVSDSPIPLSSDPFGRHPSIYEVDALPMQSYWDPVAQKFSQDPPGSRPSMSSVDDGPLDSAPPSSRFSADSSSAADSDRTKSTSPLVSVKGLTKLWRRSKPSSSPLPQPPTPGRTSFQLTSSPYPPTPTDQLMTPPVPNAVTRGSNGKAHVGQMQFDQELSYPSYPSRPSLSGSRPSSPAVHLNAPPQEKPGIRKSILKSWKSVAGGPQQPTNGIEPRKHSERPVSNETIKPRRPSVLDGSIPPSPQLPEQYLLSKHVRTGSNFIERRKSAARSKMGPGHHHSSASHDLLSIPPLPWSPVIMQTPGSASSSQSQLSAISRDSDVDTLETSQFDVVPSQKIHPNLTYPYMTLDHE